MILQLTISVLHMKIERGRDTLAAHAMLSKWQDRPATGPPKPRRQCAVLNLDTKAEIYAKLQQGALMIGYFAIRIGLGHGGSG